MDREEIETLIKFNRKPKTKLFYRNKDDTFSLVTEIAEKPSVSGCVEQWVANTYEGGCIDLYDVEIEEMVTCKV